MGAEGQFCCSSPADPLLAGVVLIRAAAHRIAVGGRGNAKFALGTSPCSGQILRFLGRQEACSCLIGMDPCAMGTDGCSIGMDKLPKARISSDAGDETQDLPALGCSALGKSCVSAPAGEGKNRLPCVQSLMLSGPVHDVTRRLLLPGGGVHLTFQCHNHRMEAAETFY
jgi:hypothetical protein